MDQNKSKSSSNGKKAISDRIESLDAFRGFLIFVMIAANFLAEYEVAPDWFKHSSIFGSIHLIDIGVALFVFTVGMAFGLSFNRYKKTHDTAKTVWRYVRRSLLFIIFGIIGSALLRREVLTDWEVFQTIGLSGLIALPFMFLNDKHRIVVGTALVFLFQIIGAAGYWNWIEKTDIGGLGGILGAIAWSGVILFGSFLSDPLRDNWPQFKKIALSMGVSLIIFGVILSFLLPMDKRLISASYLSFTMGLAALGTLFFETLMRKTRIHFSPFNILGANAMIIFMLHAVVIILLRSFFPPTSYFKDVLFALIILYAVCFTAAQWLYKRCLFVRL